jgi:DNA-binding XRE family transcriptional regulator
MPRQTTPPADYPQAVLQQIEQLAQNIVIARKRRGESQAQWAKKLGISQPTMARIERGDPSVAMASYVMCMWLINQAGGLADLIAPQHDHAALEKEVARVRKQRKQKKNETSPALPSGVETSVSTKKVSDIDGLEIGHSAKEIQEHLGGVLTAADIDRKGLDPAARVRKSLESIADQPRSSTAKDIAALLANLDPAAHARKALEDIADPLSASTAKGMAALLANLDPAAHNRKSLENIADPLSSSTAKGLAALLAKSAPKKQ